MSRPIRARAVRATGAVRGGGPAETAGYVLAAVLIVFGGALLRTPVLNWIVGPAITVVCVGVLGALAARRRAREDRR